MKIAWYTPFSADSAIGRYSHLVVQCLRQLGTEVQIVRSELKTSSMRSLPAVCKDEKYVWAADLDRDPHASLATYDLVVYNIGDHHEYHAYCFTHQDQHPGLSIVHDYSLHHSLHQYCLATSSLNGTYRDHLAAEGGGQAVAAYDEAVASNREQVWWHQQIAAYPLYRWALNRTLGVVTHAEFYRQAVQGALGCPATTIPLAYDSPVSRAEAAQSRVPRAGEPLTILTVGSVNANKRYGTVIRVLAESAKLRRQFRFRIVGAIEKPQQAMIDATLAAQRERPHVAVTGKVDRSTLHRELAQADVISCLRYPALEGASASVIEGLLSGKPVIVSDTGCYAEIPDSLVYKIDPQREHRQLSQTLERILQQPDEAQARARAAREWALERHDPANYARQLLAFCADILYHRSALATTDRIAQHLRSWNLSADTTLMARIDQALQTTGFGVSDRLRSQLYRGPNQANLAQTLPIPVLVAFRSRKRKDEYARCAFHQFYEPESLGDRRYIWTQAKSSVDCYFAQPVRLRYIWLEVSATAPQGSIVTLAVDDKTLVESKHVTGRSTLCVCLPESRVFQRLQLRIHSSTFTPAGTDPAQSDTRELGIALRAIVFAKRRAKYRRGSLFRKPLRLRVRNLVNSWLRRRAA